MDRDLDLKSYSDGDILIKHPRDLRQQRSMANADAMSYAAAAKRAGQSWNQAYIESLRRSGYKLMRITADELAGCTDVYWAAMPEEGEDAYPFPSAIV